jgi:phage terminase Nu1 subunit (DNA packaging protein)
VAPLDEERGIVQVRSAPIESLPKAVEWVRKNPRELSEGELRAEVDMLRKEIAKGEEENGRLEDEIGELTQRLADAHQRTRDIELAIGSD